MRKLIILSLILVVSILFVQDISAANSSTYIVNMFGTGLMASGFASANYEAISISVSGSGTRNAQSGTYTTNIGFFENVSYYRPVSINSYSALLASSEVGSTIGLAISATGYDKIWAVVTSPNAQEQTITLLNGQTVNYVPSPSVVGTYNVTFYANSSLGTLATAIDSFVFTAAATLTTPSTGGGGSTTIIIEKCSYNWDCTPWSVCSDGKHTRECTNTGSCEGTENQPALETECTEALFDVLIHIIDLLLDENDVLKFHVYLSEQEGVSKLDVHIKYSILDENNNELFSQIETKAVFGELIYLKELNNLGLKDGKYTLRVDVLYGNLQRAFANQKFEIEDGILLHIQIRSVKELIIYGGLAFLFAMVVFILIKFIPSFKLVKLTKFFKKGKKELNYQVRVKQNLRRIKSKAYMVVLGFVLIAFLFSPKKILTGFFIRSSTTSNIILNPLGLILIIGLFGLLIWIFRNKIKTYIKKLKERKSQDVSDGMNELMKKKVYTKDGEYIGKVKEIFIKGYNIHSLQVKLDSVVKKKNKIKEKGIIIKYKLVDSIGNVVILNENIFEQVSKLSLSKTIKKKKSFKLKKKSENEKES